MRIIFMSLSPELAFKPLRDVSQARERGGTSRMGPWTLHLRASTCLIEEWTTELSPGGLTGQVATRNPWWLPKPLSGDLAAATTHFAATRPFTEIRRSTFPLTLGRQKCQGKRGNVPVRQAAVYDVVVGRGVKRSSLNTCVLPPYFS